MQGWERAGQPGFGRVPSRARAPVITSVQGRWRANPRCRRRAVVTIWAAADKRRSRRRWGSHLRVSPVRASMGSQVGRSSASWTISSLIWFCAVSWRGRLRRPVARAARLRSSARARCRCRSSSAATGIPVVLVAKQVSRSPSASVTRYWAPGQGRSLLQTFSSNPLVVERAGRHHVCRQPPRVQVAPLAVSARHLHRHHQVVVQQRHPVPEVVKPEPGDDPDRPPAAPASSRPARSTRRSLRLPPAPACPQPRHPGWRRSRRRWRRPPARAAAIPTPAASAPDRTQRPAPFIFRRRPAASPLLHPPLTIVSGRLTFPTDGTHGRPAASPAVATCTAGTPTSCASSYWPPTEF